MRIALVAPPFIAVPPVRYGGTELFVAHLADGLIRAGHEVVVYANGDSLVPCELRSIYAHDDWPISAPAEAALKELTHTAWACEDAASFADVIHVNSGPAVPFARFINTPFILTLHHPSEPALSALYARHPEVHYVAISRAQQDQERMPHMTTVHHGLDLSRYRFVARKEGYLAFLGRIAPSKAPHLAIEVARRAGLTLKIAGEIQPCYQEYWERMVKPHIDGRQIQFVGEADLETKNELLGGASALLFPIQWNEPFGLVMIEAMACGTPVLAFGTGSVPEVVRDGVSGWICSDVEDMACRARQIAIEPASCREYVARRFTIDQMTQGYEVVYREAIRLRHRIGARLRADVPLPPLPASQPATPTRAPRSGRDVVPETTS